MTVSPSRIREVRDAILGYIYENGVSMPYFSVDPQQMKQALRLSDAEMSAATTVLHNQGLLPGRGEGIVGMIGLSYLGQVEAEALGHSVPMRDQPKTGDTHINAKYSVVQVAGAGSVQTAHLTVDQSKAHTLLLEIERSLPSLNLTPAARTEAAELVDSLKIMKPGAAARAAAAALGSILSGAGSALGQRLMETFAIVASAPGISG